MPTQTFWNLPAEKRQAIIDIAVEEFAAHDYANASISRIVARAGIAKGSIYQYFADKRELYLYLLDLASQKKLEFLQGKQPPDPRMGIFPYLSWLFREGVGFELAYPQLTRLGYRALYGSAPLPEELLTQAKAASTQYFHQLISQGIAQGDIDPAVDPHLAAFVFQAIFTELGTYLLQRLDIDTTRIAESGHLPPEFAASQAIFDQLLRILECGMAAPVAGNQ